jgi:hypothetical protein
MCTSASNIEIIHGKKKEKRKKKKKEKKRNMIKC